MSILEITIIQRSQIDGIDLKKCIIPLNPFSKNRTFLISIYRS
jgi:hypothetical protein